MSADFPEPEIEVDHPKHKKNADGLPPKFRTSKDPSLFSYSVSGQPDPAEYREAILKIKKACKEIEFTDNEIEILIADLRSEQHCFLNGEAVGYPEELTHTPDIVNYLIEKQLVGETVKFKNSVCAIVDADIKEIQTEQEFFDDPALPVTYDKFPVEDHKTPSSKVIDDFITKLRDRADACQELPRKPWIHIHCHGGNGRSSTFAAILVLVELQLQGKLKTEIDDGKDLENILAKYLDDSSFERLYPPADKKIKVDADGGPDKVESRQSLLISFFKYVKDPNGFDANTLFSDHVEDSDHHHTRPGY